MGTTKLYHLDTKSDRADYDRDILSKKEHLQVVQTNNIAHTLGNVNNRVHFLVNIDGFWDILEQVKQRGELAELIASISVHSCESANLFSFANEEWYLTEYRIIESKIKNTRTEPARTAWTNIFLDNVQKIE